MGCGSSTTATGGSSNTPVNRPGRTKPPITFVVNQEKQGGPESEISSLIQVKTVSFLIAENCPAHHTDEYDITEHKSEPKLVVRRGQAFKIQVELDRPYDQAKDKLSLEFDIGSHPTQTNGTFIKVDLDGKEEKNQWNAKIHNSKETTLIISVLPPPTCIIGRWGIHIRVSNKNSKDEKTPYAYKIYTHEHRIYILFNPWCKEDTVYLDDEGLKTEYVLNDSGKIYFGSKYRIRPRAWNFGQFDGDVLDCVLDILEDSTLDVAARNDSILVVRKLSALVNNIGDNGILVGNWSGNYNNGTSPVVWCGSVAIFEEYYKTKKPVKYGQCWVFSGVMTTACRTLGIPTRSVTNFASAHDTDASITIDKHYDINHKPIKKHNKDSVWNFHVWNDVWMSRPDLDGDNGGWQATDATPQETSDGVFCCGPCPLKALKSGDVNVPYDGHFIFAEMNADRVDWQEDEEGKFNVVKVTPSSIGFFISTHLPKCKGVSTGRGPCSDKRWEDITSEYKHSEGSNDEKVALNKANKHSTRPGEIYGHTDSNQDVKFELKEKDDIVYGQPYGVDIIMENQSGNSREVAISITLESLTSAGITDNIVRDTDDHIVIPAGEKKIYNMTVPFEEYNKKSPLFCNFRVECNCEVKETKQLFIEEDQFSMDKPDLDVTGPETCSRGDTITIEASFTNPLPIALNGCTLDVKGSKIRNQPTVFIPRVEGHGKFTKQFDITPERAGERTINVVFNSPELENISGSLEIQVT